jgi:hypothetical protein
MLCIESKIICCGQEKKLRYFNNKFNLNWKIIALFLMLRKIMQLQKNGKLGHISIFPLNYIYMCGIVEEYKMKDQRDTGSHPACVLDKFKRRCAADIKLLFSQIPQYLHNFLSGT